MPKTEKFIIDVDVVIEKYNEKNPELLPMTRKRLSEKIETTTQSFVEWKKGRNTGMIERLFKLAEIGGCSLDEFVKKTQE
jgi:hypothetical protein